MYRFTCKHCKKVMEEPTEEELLDHVHDHMHIEHGKHISESKILKGLREDPEQV